MSCLFEDHTQEEHAQALANFLPNGRLFEAKNIQDSLYRQFLRGLASVHKDVEELLGLFSCELDLTQVFYLLEEWEETVGLPDDCFDVEGKTIEERRQQVLIKLAALGVQTEADFVNLAAIFDLDIVIRSGIEHFAFTMIFPIIFLETAKRARFTMIVEYEADAASTFTYTFPFVFGNSQVPIVQCLFKKLVPASVDVYFIQKNAAPIPGSDDAFSSGFSDGFS